MLEASVNIYGVAIGVVVGVVNNLFDVVTFLDTGTVGVVTASKLRCVCYYYVSDFSNYLWCCS